MLYYLVYLPVSFSFIIGFFAVAYLLILQLTSIPGLNDVTVATSTQSQIQSNAVTAPQNELTHQDGVTSSSSNINSNANVGSAVNGVAQPVSDPSTVSCSHIVRHEALRG